jgi:ABC-type phosphate/phosphonate transport system substrate-binding protein
MYSISPEVAQLWRELLTAVFVRAGEPVTLFEHPAPAPLEQLWGRPDLGAVFMCGLPYSRARPQPHLVVAPVPSPAEYAGEPRYWSELVVRADSPHRTLADTYGTRLALTVPGSQSGCAAVLAHLMSQASGGDASNPAAQPPYRVIVAPTVTPLGALSAVIQREADVAPIDSYAYALLQRFRPDLTFQVRSVARTAPTPIPALVSSEEASPALRSAFLEAHHVPATRALMERLLLQRFVRAEPVAYEALRERHDAATAFWRAGALAQEIHPAFLP